MVMNRIADIFLILAIILIIIKLKVSEYIIIFDLIKYIQNDFYYILGCKLNILSLISGLILIGAIGKSAQIGFHTWLPDAMEGPTPVSALLHAATMVTAGIFLVLRCSILFEFSNNILQIMAFLGGITAFFSAVCCIFQNDIKKL